jgi:hypothetical protein
MLSIHQESHGEANGERRRLGFCMVREVIPL